MLSPKIENDIANRTFKDSLVLESEFTTKSGDVININGGKIKNCEFNLTSYGFDAELTFVIILQEEKNKKDPIFEDFIKSDLLEVKLSVTGYYGGIELHPTPEPIVLQGLVTEKKMEEFSSGPVKDASVLVRKYTIFFSDHASVFWQQHFPVELTAKTTLKKVIEGHIPKGLELNIKWDIFENNKALIFFNLGDEFKKVSFYDFLMWYIRLKNGVLTYQTPTSKIRNPKYTISEEKISDGKTVKFDHKEVFLPPIFFPEPPKFDVNVLSPSLAVTQKKTIKQDSKIDVTMPRFDVYEPYRSSSDILVVYEDLHDIEEAKLFMSSQRQHERKLIFRKFPEKTLLIQSMVKLNDADWKHTFAYNTEYRVVSINFNANTESNEFFDDYHASEALYQVQMEANMETKDNPWIHLPECRTPYYPLEVEGEIFCELGKHTDKPYSFLIDEDSKQSFYQVKIPLWNQTIPVQYSPNAIAGHLYFPLYKNTRVLVRLYFDYAEIVRILEWGENVKLDQNNQPNQILLGLNPKSNLTMKSYYKNEDLIFHLERLDSGGNNKQTMQFKNGCWLFQGGVAKVSDSLIPVGSAPTQPEENEVKRKANESKNKLAEESEKEQQKTNLALEESRTEVDTKLKEESAKLEAAAKEITTKIQSLLEQVPTQMDASGAASKLQDAASGPIGG